MGLAGSASATLFNRDIGGDTMVYDDKLNITWTRNANLPGSSGLFWADAKTWAEALMYGGKDDWRLPYASVSAGAGPITTLTIGFPCTGAGGADEVACRDNEMAYMFYYNLDGNQGADKTGNQTALGGEVLTGIQRYYWSGTKYDSVLAWNFVFFNGSQFEEEGFGLSAWAVRPGDVAAAPEPASLLLIGAGMLGLGWSRRKWRRR
jgi:hypothetical protein